jgi:hypothetical protein
MAEGEIIVESGVSWLRDTLMKVAQERLDLLTEGIADGVPLHEYTAMVGRRKEAKRWVNITLPELFIQFQEADDAAFEQDGLEEMPDD